MNRTPLFLLAFHQDERLSADTFWLPDGFDVQTVEPALTPGGKLQRLRAVSKALGDAMQVERTTGSTHAVVSGDCLFSLPILAALQRAGLEPALVWFDAHGDLHTLESSTSGYLGGMSLRMALGADPEVLTASLGLRPLREDQVALVGARDLDPAEVAYLATSRIRRPRVEDVNGELQAPAPLFVHVDVDVIDGDEVPGLSFPSSNGPSATTVFGAVRRLRDTGRVIALHISCPWRPPASLADAHARGRLLAGLLEGLLQG